MKKTTTILIACALTLASCNRSSESTGTTTPNHDPSPALLAVIDAETTGEAWSIHELRQAASTGDTVTIKGWVIGNSEPFVEGRAAFILGDPSIITPCNLRSGDACSTPWDACCDTPEDLARAIATIQIVDANGRVLKEGIEGVGGIDKLAKLKVTGQVAEGSTENNLIINATAIDLDS